MQNSVKPRLSILAHSTVLIDLVSESSNVLPSESVDSLCRDDADKQACSYKKAFLNRERLCSASLSEHLVFQVSLHNTSHVPKVRC